MPVIDNIYALIVPVLNIHRETVLQLGWRAFSFVSNRKRLS